MIQFLLIGGLIFGFLVILQAKFSPPPKTSAVQAYLNKTYGIRSQQNISKFVDVPEKKNQNECEKDDSDFNKRILKIPKPLIRELRLLCQLVVKDFINYWYDESITDSGEFPARVYKTLFDLLSRLSDRLLRVHLPLFIFRDISLALRHQLRWYTELSNRTREKCESQGIDFSNMKQEEKNKLLSREFQHAGHLHPATCLDLNGSDVSSSTNSYLRKVSTELVIRLLEKEDFECGLMRCFFTEVLTFNLLIPGLESISPSTICNGLLQCLGAFESCEEANSPNSPCHKEMHSNSFREDSDPENRTEQMWKYYSADVDETGAEHALEKLSPGSFILWNRTKDSVQVSYVDSKNRVKHANINLPKNRNIDTELQRFHPPLTLGVCAKINPRKKHGSFTIKLVTAPWVQTSDGNQLGSPKCSTNEAIETKDSDVDSPRASSTEFISKARRTIEREASDRYILSIQAAVENCIAYSLVNDEKIASTLPCVQQLVHVLDEILRHGIIEQPHSKNSNSITSDKASVQFDEPYVEFLKRINLWLGYEYLSTHGNLKTLTGTSALTSTAYIPIKTLKRSSKMVRIHRRKDSQESSIVINESRPGREWIMAAIVSGILDLWLQEVAKCDEVLSNYYLPGAIMRDQSKLATIQSIVGALKNIRFTDVTTATSKKPHKSKKYEQKPKKRNVVMKIVKRNRNANIGHGHNRDAFRPRIGPIRAKIIGAHIVKAESNQFVEFVIKCELTSQSDRSVYEWTVNRRYSKFYVLHYHEVSENVILYNIFPKPNYFVYTKLKKRYPRFDHVKLPRRHFKVFGNFDETFISKRQQELNKYLSAVCQHPALSYSVELLSFLSSDIKTGDEGDVSSDDTIYSEDDKEELVSSDDGDDEEEEEVLNQDYKLNRYDLETSETHFSKLVMEVFNFHELGWVKRSLIALIRSVIAFSMNGQVKRWIEEKYTRKKSADQLSYVVAVLRELFWPGGEFMTQEDTEEVEEEDLDTLRANVFDAMQNALPSNLVSFLGKERCYTGCDKVAGFLQNPVCVSNLVFEILDLLLVEVFPDFPIERIHEETISEYTNRKTCL